MNKQEALEQLKWFRDKSPLYSNDKDFTEPLDAAISALEQQLNNGWIPVSERLPEKRKEVLVEIKLNGYYSIVIGSYCKIFGKWEIGNDVMGYDWEEEMVDEVIAWQPLPEPYKEVSQ